MSQSAGRYYLAVLVLTRPVAASGCVSLSVGATFENRFENTMSNPVEKAAAASSLPREARARVAATTDPVPRTSRAWRICTPYSTYLSFVCLVSCCAAGKVLHTHPQHHFPVVPASHDVDRTEPKSSSELGLPQGEIDKLQRAGREHGANAVQSGMDHRGAATTANKLMDSRKHRADFSGDRHNKHLDSVYRNTPK